VHRPIVILGRRARDERGFTLVELLVVILIIGILAAIALPVFLGQRSRAQDADAKSAVVTAVKALEIYKIDHGTYATATPTGLADTERSLAVARGLTLSDLGDDSFTVSVDSVSGAAGGGPFTASRRPGGPVERTCAGPGRGACPSDSSW
jgi:type IV pilus assembly protein PilA